MHVISHCLVFYRSKLNISKLSYNGNFLEFYRIFPAPLKPHSHDSNRQPYSFIWTLDQQKLTFKNNKGDTVLLLVELLPLSAKRLPHLNSSQREYANSLGRVSIFSSCMCGLLSGTTASSHRPKTCRVTVTRCEWEHDWLFVSMYRMWPIQGVPLPLHSNCWTWGPVTPVT